MLLSGLMLPMTLGPAWLDVLSHLMPFRYLVDAVRDAYVGSYATAHMLYGALVAVGFGAGRDGGHTSVPDGRGVTTLGAWSI
jgi:ABC-2 type transport system permease protein